MRTIDADRLLSDRMKSTYYHLPNGDIAIPIIDIEHAPTVGDWISVQDRLPKDALDVLVYSKRCGIGVGCYIAPSNEWWRYGDLLPHAIVTHWKPLPEPPKET